MPPSDLAATLAQLFDAERAVRNAHDALVERPRARSFLSWRRRRAKRLDDTLDEDEASLRLVRLSELLGEMEGPRVVDLLIDIVNCEDPDARRSGGEALAGLAWDRFKEVALGVERALERLPPGSPALAELPYMLAEIPEGGAMKLLGRFLAHSDPDAVAAAIEAIVETGDPSVLPMLDRLKGDTRKVELEDEGGTQGDATIGELVAEAHALLSGKGAP